MKDSSSEFMQELTHIKKKIILFPLFSYCDPEFRDMPKNFPVGSILSKHLPEGMFPKMSSGKGAALIT